MTGSPHGIGRLHGVVVDCPDPSLLASFYAELLGMQRVVDEPDWVVIGDAADRPGLAFARVAGYRPPTWPTGVRPQYRHFDVAVDDLAEAGRLAEQLGAVRAGDGGETYAVFTDPVGHPFCLVRLG